MLSGKKWSFKELVGPLPSKLLLLNVTDGVGAKSSKMTWR